MTRLPIRIRLTLAFAVAMAAVIAGMGLFVYLRVGGALLGRHRLRRELLVATFAVTLVLRGASAECDSNRARHNDHLRAL